VDDAISDDVVVISAPGRRPEGRATVRRLTLIFLRHLFACDLSFTFCDFDTVALLMTSTAVTHYRLTVIS